MKNYLKIVSSKKLASPLFIMLCELICHNTVYTCVHCHMDSEDEMYAQIGRFLDFAKSHPELTFLVTEIGCGIAGYSPEQIAPHFKDHSKNVILPDSFTQILK